MSAWENLDVEELFARREEQTVSSNVGGFVVPLGTPLRREFPTTTKGYTKVKHPYLPDHESVEYSDSGSSDYEWALKQVK